MPFMLSQEHHDFFNKNHFIEFDFLVSPRQCLTLYNEITEKLKEQANPDHPLLYDNLYRTFPKIPELVVRNRLAYFVSELIYRKPLWLVYDKLFIYPEDLSSYEVDETHDCCLFLYLKNDKKSGNGIFFQTKTPEVACYDPDTSVLLLAFTYRTMPENCPKFYV